VFDLLHRDVPPDEVGIAAPQTGFVAVDSERELRARLPEVIANQLTDAATRELRRLASKYPNHWRLRLLARLHANAIADATWEPFTVDRLVTLVQDRDLRLVNDASQLSEVVIEALDRLQNALTASTGLATLLWNRQDDEASTGWWPSWEDDLSDLVAGFLKLDLKGQRVVINREVQVVRPRLSGQRTDIHIQAHPLHRPPDTDPITVVIECKGCWNRGVLTAIEAQLVGQYLSRNPRWAGVYLVGYFDCERWTRQQRAARRHPRHDLGDLRSTLKLLAAEQVKQKSVSVKVAVLDCCLDAAQSSEPAG
jgi:hypothetical protein